MIKKLIKSILIGALMAIPLVSSAQVSSPNYWLPSSTSPGTTLKPLSPSYSLTIPQLGGSGVQCVQVSNLGLFSTSGSGPCGSGGGGGSTTVITSSNPFLVVNQVGANATLTAASALSVQSSVDISFNKATGTNIQATFLNPKGFITGLGTSTDITIWKTTSSTTADDNLSWDNTGFLDIGQLTDTNPVGINLFTNTRSSTISQDGGGNLTLQSEGGSELNLESSGVGAGQINGYMNGSGGQSFNLYDENGHLLFTVDQQGNATNQASFDGTNFNVTDNGTGNTSVLNGDSLSVETDLNVHSGLVVIDSGNGGELLSNTNGSFSFATGIPNISSDGSHFLGIGTAGFTGNHTWTIADEDGSPALGAGNGVGGDCASWSDANTLTDSGSPCFVSINNLTGSVIATGTTNQINVSSSTGQLVFSISPSYAPSTTIPTTYVTSLGSLSGVIGTNASTGIAISTSSGNKLSIQNVGVTSISSGTDINASAPTGSVTLNFVNPGFVTSASSVTWSASQIHTATTTFQSSTIITYATGTILSTNASGSITTTTYGGQGLSFVGNTLSWTNPGYIAAGSSTTFIALNQFNATTVFQGSVSTTIANALLLGNASGVISAYGGASNCSAGQAVIGLSNQGTTTCASFGSGSGTVTTSSAPTIGNVPYWANTTGGLNGTSSLSIVSSTGAVTDTGALNIQGIFSASSSATIIGSLTVSSTLTQANGVVSLASTTINGQATTTGLTVTGVASTSQLYSNSSTLTGLLFTTATGTNNLTVASLTVTSVASTSQLYSNSSTLTGLTFTNATGSNNLTIASFTVTSIASTSNLYANSSTITGLNFTNATGSNNLTVSSFTVTSIASTSNLYANSSTLTGLNFTNATGSNNLTVASLTVTSIASTSQQYSGSSTITSLSFVNATGTNNLTIASFTTTGIASTSQLYANSSTIGTLVINNTSTIKGNVSSTETSSLLYASSTGVWTGLTLGTNLSISGGALNASGGAGGGTVTTSTLPVVGNIPYWATVAGALNGTSSLSIVSSTGAVTAANNFFVTGVQAIGTTTLPSGYSLNIVGTNTSSTGGTQMSIMNTQSSSYSEYTLTEDNGTPTNNFGGLFIDNSNAATGTELSGDVGLEASTTGGIDIESLNQGIRLIVGGIYGSTTPSNTIFTATTTGVIVNGNATTTNLTITSVTGTQCLHSISGVVSGSGSDCGSGGGSAPTSTFWVPWNQAYTRVGALTLNVVDASNASNSQNVFVKGTVIKYVTGTSTTSTYEDMVTTSTYQGGSTTINIIGDNIPTNFDSTSSLEYKLEKARVTNFGYAGNIGATSTDVMGHFYAPMPMKIFGSDCYVGTAGVTGTTTFELAIQGTENFGCSISTTATSSYNNGAATGANASSAMVLSVNVSSTQTATSAIDGYINLFWSPSYDVYLQ